MRKQATPEEIQNVLNILRMVWLKHPAQRLGQLLLNVTRDKDGKTNTAILWNDDEVTLIEKLKEWL